MKISQLFGQTLRDAPSESEVVSHQLLMRAGFIRPLGAGIFSYLHLAKRSMMKIESIMREEMDRIGGQEISMPVVHTAEVWKETGRWYQIGNEMGRFKDKNDHDMVLAMTHEEVVADLVRREVQSYKQMPRMVYQIQTKWRDDPRPRAGLIRAREFTMKDSYSLDTDWEGLDKQYRAHYQAYFNIYHRCGLNVRAVRSDNGMILAPSSDSFESAGPVAKLAHEFMYLTPIGEDMIILCEECGYSANRQVARIHKTPATPEAIKSVEKVHTPKCKSIENLATFLGIPKSKTAKAVFFIASFPDPGVSHESNRTEKFIFAIIRGDMALNETKLATAVAACDLRTATEEEIRNIGAVPGFASPIFLNPNPIPTGEKRSVMVIVDDSITSSPNLVAGANEVDFHLVNTNIPRDYTADIVADIATASEGAACPECSHPLVGERGVEVGNIFKLGTDYSEALGCSFLDKDGQQRPVIMGSYGIGVGRLLACIAEEYHDDRGLIWPVTIAPYQVHLVSLSGNGKFPTGEIAANLYDHLQTAGIEVLFDDRNESPGIKFNDADLIGLPIRITISERSLDQGGIEIKMRNQTDKVIIPLDGVASTVRSALEALKVNIGTKIIPVDYNG
jgi:prolyl-tRNA synthetase